MNKKVKHSIIGFTVTILIISLFGIVNHLQKLNKLNEYNLKINNKKIILLKKKHDDLLFVTKGYIADKRELKKYNDSLYSELKKIKGDVITLNHVIIGLKQDTVELRRYLDALHTQMHEPIKRDTNTWDIGWELYYDYGDNNYDNFIGNTTIKTYCDDDIVTITHKNTEIIKRASVVNLLWGQYYSKDGVQVYVKSTHPALNIESMEGVFVKYPKKRHWFTGFGVGPSLNFGYDFINKRTAFVGGISLHYNIYQW
jgi:hypothetical protein